MSESEHESRNAGVRIGERLTARMARMERTHRRLRWSVRGLLLATILLMVLVALPLVGPAPEWTTPAEAAPEVRAHRFALLDSSGSTRGVWQLGEDGAVRLTIHDDAGRSRLNLAVLKEGSPGISLSDGEERKRVVLGLLPDQTSTLVFADPAGVPRAVLGLSHQQAANLLFADAGGIGRVSLGLDPSGRGSAMIPGTTHARPEVEADPEPPVEEDGTP